MELDVTVIARNRAFAGMVERVRVRLGLLFEALAGLALKHPIHEAILVAVTDTKPDGFFEIVDTKDEYFQVMAGCAPTLGSAASEDEFFEALTISFSKDGDFLGSPFGTAFGIGSYDDATREAEYWETRPLH